MKTKKSNLLLQREVIEKKLRPWLSLRADLRPNSGWIKAIRGALGMSAQQLANRIGVAQPNVTAFEKRESEGTITLEALERIAAAMECKLVYAIVPKDEYSGLHDLLDHQSQQVAKMITSKVSHSMSLEAQSLSDEENQQSLVRVARDLKEKGDSRIWDIPLRKGKK